VKRQHLALAGILMLAAALRVWGIGFGQDHPLTRPDEEAIVGVATHFFTRDFNPHFFNYPTLFLYAVAVVYFAYFKVGRTLGWFRSDWRFLQYTVTHTAPFRLMARYVSALSGVATVWVLHRIALRLVDRTTALLAAVFLAVSFLHVRDSHFGVTDIAATFMVSVAFLFVLRLAESGTARAVAAAGVTAGLAASTKYNAALIVVPALWVLLGPGSRRAASWSVRAKTTALYASCAISAFVALSPYVLIDWKTFLAAIAFESGHLRDGHGTAATIGWVSHLKTSLTYGLGPWRLLAGVAGLTLLVWRDWRKGVLVASFPIVYYAALGGGYTVFVRYILPVVPFLCLGGAVAVTWGARWAAGVLKRPAWQPAIAWALALFLLGPSSVRIVRLDWILDQDDSRVLASQWVQRAFPGGALVGQHGTGFARVQFPVDYTNEPTAFQTVEFDFGQNVFVDRRQQPARWPEVLITTRVPVPQYDEDPIHLVDAVGKRYVLVHAIRAFQPPLGDAPRVYDAQDAFFVPLAGFDGIERPGPNVAIYVRSDQVDALPADLERRLPR
jgi:4-amino-4-deoxy-L-arabinose transferase-like glycosyltransferase